MSSMPDEQSPKKVTLKPGVKKRKLHAVSEEEAAAEELGVVDIDIGDEPKAVWRITNAINDGKFEGLFQQGGNLYRVRGDPAAGPVQIAECTPAGLRNILAKHAYTYKTRSTGAGTSEIPALPSEALCRACLANESWSVPELRPNWDRWALRVPEGTLDLLTGEVRESTLADLHTCQARVHYDPAAGSDCPKFMALLHHQLPSEEEQETLLDALAYMLTGATNAQLFFWLQGVPHSAKSTVAKLMIRMLGSYATVADDDLFFGRADVHPTNIAALEGKRLVVQDEIPENRQLRLERLREHTGTNTVRGREMRHDFRNIAISWKILFTSNPKAKMSVRSKDGVWRRMVLFHCTQAVPLRDRKSMYENEIFAEEGSQILNLLLARLPQIRRRGIVVAGSITSEVDSYQEEVDLETSLFTDILKPSDAWLSNDDLMRAWKQAHPDENYSTVQLGLAMKEAGYKKTPTTIRWRKEGVQRTKVMRGWIGVTLVDDEITLWQPVNKAPVTGS